MGKQFLDYEGLKTYHKNVKAQFDNHIDKINNLEKNKADLDDDGTVPMAQIPDYVDDVVSFYIQVNGTTWLEDAYEGCQKIGGKVYNASSARVIKSTLGVADGKSSPYYHAILIRNRDKATDDEEVTADFFTPYALDPDKVYIQRGNSSGSNMYMYTATNNIDVGIEEVWVKKSDQASKDGTGKTISTTYATKTELATKIGFGDTYNDSEHSDTIPVFGRYQEPQLISSGLTVNDLQRKLVSGSNIKTINNTTLLGSGNITFEELGMEPLTELDILEVFGETEILQSIDTE